MTGGSGYIGSVIVEKAIARGYVVHVLSRTETSDDKIRALGAVPVRGDLGSHDVLREQSAQSDMVLYLAHMRDVGVDYAEVLRADQAAVDAIAAGLEGSNKPLVITSATLVVEPTGEETTEDSPLAENPLNDRFKAEIHALNLVGRGIRVSVVRLPPFVYGRGGSGIFGFMKMFAKGGECYYVGSGVRTTGVHVDDAATLFLLAAESARAGDIINAVSNSDITTRELSEAMGAVLELPVVSLSFDDAVAKFGPFLPRLLTTESRASGAKAQNQFGWQPKEPGVVQDIKTGSYVAAAARLKKSAT